MSTKGKAAVPEFDAGEEAALIMLHTLEITVKRTKDGMRLRYGSRGRLGPPEVSLAGAIMAFIEEGPQSRVFPNLMELYLAASCAMCRDPEAELFTFVDDVLDVVAQRAIGDAQSPEPTPRKAGVVLAFPTLKRKP